MTVTRQYTCEQCECAFERSNIGRYPQRFCGILCRNTFNSRNRRWPDGYVRKWKVCPKCGHGGMRAEPLCYKCGGCRHPGKSYWTPEQVAYIIEHYALEGTDAVAQALEVSPNQVHSKAGKLGLRIAPDLARLSYTQRAQKMSKASRQRVIEGARAHMLKSNPMKRAEVVEKVKAWRRDNPEKTAEILTKLRVSHQRIQRDKPSQLEWLLRDLLMEFGIEYEPSAIIKDKFIVDIRIGTLIIQADGDYWHGHPRFEPLTDRQSAQQRRDRAQDAYLRACGYTVVRIWESDMTRDKVAAILREHHLIAVA